MNTDKPQSDASIVAQPEFPVSDVRECPPMSDLGQLSQLEGSSLNDKQLFAVRLLITGKSLGIIAKKIGIDVRTLHRWRQNETFRREVAKLRRQLWSEATDRLRALVHPSLDVLEQELRKGYDRARYRAANAVLRHANLRKSTPLDANAEEQEDEEFEG